MRSMVVVAMLSTGARADDVNLLTSTPATVAVSSTVANAAILPDHLVDGKLSTAWNSQTGELAGAWIAVRLPADARVTAVKLTAGFTHKVKKQDFFTMNPRIKKIRISQGGKVLVEKELDVENRGLQTIPVAIAGGDFEVRVVEVVPGTKKSWRETCVSELEVWGTTPKVVKTKPSVRLRSLDAAPSLTREQCITAALPARKGHTITYVEDVPLSDAVVICRVDHKEKGSTDTEVEIAAVKRARREVIGSVSASITNDTLPEEGIVIDGSVQLATLPLTQTETGLVVTTVANRGGPMLGETRKVSRLYRVTASALTPILEWKTTEDGGEATHSDTCELQPFTPGKAMPNLVVACAEERGHWHDENPDDRGVDRKERKERYRWDGTTYVRN